MRFMVSLNIALLFFLCVWWSCYFKYFKIPIRDKKLFFIAIHIISFMFGIVFIPKLLPDVKIDYYVLRSLSLVIIFDVFNSVGGVIVNLIENNIKFKD